jgi:tetratricopeptide (TPR) repeat protein
MLHRRLLENEAAIECFREAAHLDPTYFDRGYFHRDLGSVLFESGRYDDAVESYARAVELGAADVAPALLADALLWAGRYREAQEQFDRYLGGRDRPDDAEWRLKLAVLPLLRSVAGDVQARRPDEAVRLVEPVDFEHAVDMTPDEAWRRLDEAIALDACCAEAWFRRTIMIIGETQAVERAAPSALAAAVLHRENPPAWSNALVTTDPGNEQRLRDVLYAGYQHGRDGFADAALEVSDAEHLRESANRIIALLDEVARQVERYARDEGFTMRFNSAGGVVREVVFSPPSA